MIAVKSFPWGGPTLKSTTHVHEISTHSHKPSTDFSYRIHLFGVFDSELIYFNGPEAFFHVVFHPPKPDV